MVLIKMPYYSRIIFSIHFTTDYSQNYSSIIDTCLSLTSSKELKSFLGLANFYRHFVPKFANNASPFNELTGSNTTFSWNKNHQQAFDHLKQALSSPPVMSYPTKKD